MTTQRQPTVTEQLAAIRTTIDETFEDGNVDGAIIELCSVVLKLCSVIEQLDATAKRAANYADCTANGITPDW